MNSKSARDPRNPISRSKREVGEERRESSLERADQILEGNHCPARGDREAEGDVGRKGEKGSGAERLKSEFWSESKAASVREMAP